MTKIVDLYSLHLKNGYDSDELVRDLQSPAAVILNFAYSTIFCVVKKFKIIFGEELFNG